jgi:SAM-dependent methyltransferase
MKAWIQRALAALLILEGAVLLVIGRGWILLWAKLLRRTPVEEELRAIARIPNWTWRSVGVAEMGLGMRLLRDAPLYPATFYGAWAGLYSRIGVLWRDIGYQPLFYAMAQELGMRLRPQSSVLDLGFGTGENLDHLLALHLPFDSYLGIDVTPEMVAEAREKFGDSSRVRFLQLDLLQDPWPKDQYDLILATWFLEHVPDPAHLAGHALAHLRPGGAMIIVSEVYDGSLRARLANLFWGLIGARLPEKDVYRTLPGLESLQFFDGMFAPTAMAVLSRPAAE